MSGDGSKKYTFDLGDNLTKVLVGLVGVAMLVIQIYTAAKTSANGDKVERVEQRALVVEKEVGAVKKDVRAGRNDSRRIGGHPPVTDDKE